MTAEGIPEEASRIGLLNQGAGIELLKGRKAEAGI